MRNERELERIGQYILDNPAGWPDDPNNVWHDFVVMPNHVHGIVWLPRTREPMW